MRSNEAAWAALVSVVGGGFLLLGFFGREIYRQAPPIPSAVVTESGRTLMTSEQILDGQQVWQSIGGQQIGSIWGHGAYQAPDWSADWLHREAIALLEVWSHRDHGVALAELTTEQRGALELRLRRELRGNHVDAQTGVLVVSDARAEAMRANADYYSALFGGDPSLDGLRKSYALHDDAITDPARLERLANFFFWTSWACVTERPGQSFTYTNNWPHEPLVGNEPTAASVVWSLLSIVLLLGAVATMVWFHSVRSAGEEPVRVPERDPLARLVPTPSMRALGKYVAVVVALFAVQVLLGGALAHYAVEGDSFYGWNLSVLLPYAVARTWHIQLALFWIATSFLAAGLFLAPVIGGREPRFQRAGVNLLFGALLVVVVGSLAGEWLSIKQHFTNLTAGFWFGHQGYEYVDLGRFWQIALYVGLILWLVLMLRGLWPALRARTAQHGIISLLTASVVAIGLLYGSGLFYGARSHLAVSEYWRWWVIHLWVEGFFEVFATGAMAFLFTTLGLVRVTVATRGFIAATTIFLLGGIPGTFHHLYFSGTPISVTAIGAMFSALEVVPLVLIGREAIDTLRMQGKAQWMVTYRWPIRFFVGVAFWNLVGAGLFGFLINPPIALYYLQGLNTTPVHAHTALFGVYGLLSLGLILLIMRRLGSEQPWREGALSYSFWAMNVGLALMVLLSVLPIGIAQAWASVETGLWYARSAEFLQQPLLQNLRWMRLVGDTIFLSGVATFVWFALGLMTGWSYQAETEASKEWDALTEPA
ncbi:MAG: nitric-oxide reductase large subunit [Deltaproteobacteria bacterium]|nr:nitric-oxide reductase large subunit [Deltaproteobacteria bacterium]